MNRFIKTVLAATLLTTMTQSYAALAANVSPAEKAKIEAVVHQYLLEKPEVLMEAMQVLQRRQYDQAEQTVKQTQKTVATYAKPLFHQANDPIAGNPNGKVTVVEFFDYQCPHCTDMAPVIASIIKSNPNVRFVFKEFPIRGPQSEMAARAALAANKQGKYYDFSHALLTMNKPLTEEVIMQAAQTAGINVTQLKKDMSDTNINNQLQANIKLAQDLKLFGTPAFFVGPTDTKDANKINYIPGRMDLAQLQAAIDKANQS